MDDAMGLYEAARDYEAIGDIMRHYRHHETIGDIMRHYETL